jgi:hypothetical protein
MYAAVGDDDCAEVAPLERERAARAFARAASAWESATTSGVV